MYPNSVGMSPLLLLFCCCCCCCPLLSVVKYTRLLSISKPSQTGPEVVTVLLHCRFHFDASNAGQIGASTTHPVDRVCNLAALVQSMCRRRWSSSCKRLFGWCAALPNAVVASLDQTYSRWASLALLLLPSCNVGGHPVPSTRGSKEVDRCPFSWLLLPGGPAVPSSSTARAVTVNVAVHQSLCSLIVEQECNLLSIHALHVSLVLSISVHAGAALCLWSARVGANHCRSCQHVLYLLLLLLLLPTFSQTHQCRCVEINIVSVAAGCSSVSRQFQSCVPLLDCSSFDNPLLLVWLSLSLASLPDRSGLQLCSDVVVVVSTDV